MTFFLVNRATYKDVPGKRFVYSSFDKGIEIFTALSIVTAFYVIASWMVDGSSDQSTLGYLWKLEDEFANFKNFLSSHLIFKPWISALLIAILIVVDFVYAYIVSPGASVEEQDKEKPKSLVSRYFAFQKLTRRAYLVLTLLCAFTFFGNAVVGEKIARVQIRIGKIRTGYEEVRKEVEATLTAAVQQRLFERIDSSIAGRPAAPVHVYSYHDIVYKTNSRVEHLRKSYSTAKSNDYVRLEPALEARVTEVTSKLPPSYDGPREVPYADNLPRESVTEAPAVESRPANLEELTIGKVEEVNNSLKSTANIRRSISAVRLADGTEILVQLPKSFTNVAKGAVFKGLTLRFPFLEPMFDALISTFDQSMEERIKNKVGPTLNAFLDKWFPGKKLSKDNFQFEAEEIVKASSFTVTEGVIKDTEAGAGEFNKVIAKSDVLSKELDGRVEIALATHPPPSALPLKNVNTLPKPTCPAEALENYMTRLGRAKTEDEFIDTEKIFDSDLKRLKGP